jgi:hypothetical protein
VNEPESQPSTRGQRDQPDPPPARKRETHESESY